MSEFLLTRSLLTNLTLSQPDMDLCKVCFNRTGELNMWPGYINQGCAFIQPNIVCTDDGLNIDSCMQTHFGISSL